jgi:hypothetical protein
MTTIYFAGGEDSEFYSWGADNSISTTANSFRSTYARCSLTTRGNGYWQNWLSFPGTPTSIWFTGQVSMNNVGAGAYPCIAFVDSSNLVRLQMILSNPIVFQKVNTAGSATTLTNTLSSWANNGFKTFGAGTDQIVIQFINAVSGTLNVWMNGVLRYNYSGDTTTETTALASLRLSCTGSSQQGGWSEIIVADQDVRSWNLQTLAPVANGNSHSFDTGSPAAANVNEVTLSYATLDGSSSAGQIDQYTIPSIAAGSYSIVAIGVSAQLVKGTSGPTKMDLGVRSGGSDYWSSDQSPTLSWSNYQNWWTSDPNTSATWSAYPANIGLKSVA